LAFYNKLYFDPDHIDRHKKTVARFDEDHVQRQKYLQDIKNVVK